MATRCPACPVPAEVPCPAVDGVHRAPHPRYCELATRPGWPETILRTALADAGREVPAPAPAIERAPPRLGLLALWACDYRVPVLLTPAEGFMRPEDRPYCGCTARCLAGMSRREDGLVSSECGSCQGWPHQ